tara:strand:- start:992 stop:3454 length:2463 start_codon:yes stop_codon:yes gene_type:complete
VSKKQFIAHKRKSDGAIQQLEVHLLETGEIAGQLAAKVGLSEVGFLLGVLHDFGKYSAEFQNYLKSATAELNQDDEEYVDADLLKGKIDHSTAGAQFVYKKLHSIGGIGQGELLGQIMAVCIASHHSGLIDTLSVDTDKGNVFAKRVTKEESKAHMQECESNASDEILAKAESLLNPELVQGFMGLFKKMAPSPSAAFELISSFQIGFLTRFLFSCLIDADRLNSAEFEEPSRLAARSKRSDKPCWDVAIDRLEAKIAGFELNNPIDQIRCDISQACLDRAPQKTGIYTLTVPTGGGKTYASLRYALHHARKNSLEQIFYIIPYTSIIEQNAAVMRVAIEREGDTVPWIHEHHSNLEPENQTWHSKLVSENWDAPIVITTMVQFLETMFSGGTRSVRRLHQFANSVIVFDEVQTLPIKCLHLYCNALNFLVNHANSSVLLCTATQPVLNQLDEPSKGQLLIPESHELIPNVALLFDELKRVNIQNCIKPEGWTETELADFSIQQLREKGSCLVIVNTKDWAIKLYQLCTAGLEKEALFHLSTNQCPAHRKKLLDVIKQRLVDKLPVLCLSTQLIEAGVDVDFTSVIRFVAGLDSIAQAAGRCNRNGWQDSATVYVVNPEKENTKWLEEIEVGKEKTLRVFSEGFNDLLAPKAIQRYFQYYFFDRKEKMTYPCRDSQGKDTTLLNLLSNHSGNPLGVHKELKGNKRLPNLQQAFMEAGKIFKAIEAPTQAVIVPYENGLDLITQLCAVAKEFDPKCYYELLKKAQKYSVNVFPNIWKKLVEADAIAEIQEGEGIFYLKQEYYSDEFGLSVEPVARQNIYAI